MRPIGHHTDLGPRSKPLARRVFGSLHRAMLLHRQLMMRKMSDHGVASGQALCLKELGHNDGITQRDLAELLLVSRPTVTVMLKKMEKAGLVTREVDEKDQRFTRIHLTQAGMEAHNSMHAAVDEIVAQTIGSLPEKDQAELDRLLGALSDTIVAALGDDTDAEMIGPAASLSGEDGDAA